MGTDSTILMWGSSAGERIIRCYLTALAVRVPSWVMSCSTLQAYLPPSSLKSPPKCHVYNLYTNTYVLLVFFFFNHCSLPTKLLRPREPLPRRQGRTDRSLTGFACAQETRLGTTRRGGNGGGLSSVSKWGKFWRHISYINYLVYIRKFL